MFFCRNVYSSISAFVLDLTMRLSKSDRQCPCENLFANLYLLLSVKISDSFENKRWPKLCNFERVVFHIKHTFLLCCLTMIPLYLILPELSAVFLEIILEYLTPCESEHPLFFSLDFSLNIFPINVEGRSVFNTAVPCFTF